jgi:hypothetical protein
LIHILTIFLCSESLKTPALEAGNIAACVNPVCAVREFGGDHGALNGRSEHQKLY